MAPRPTLLVATACALALLTGCGSGPSRLPVTGPTGGPVETVERETEPAKTKEKVQALADPENEAVPEALPKKGKPLAASPTATPTTSAKPDPDSPNPNPNPNDPNPNDPAPDQPAPTQPDDEPDTARGMSAVELKVLELTNGERAKEGCPALRGDDRLATAARLHSKDMADQDYFSHTSKDGSSPWDRIKRQGYTDPGAENIAMGYPTPEAVMRGWMDSPGHRANILNCKLKAIGVGVQPVTGGKGPWWTQNFGWS